MARVMKATIVFCLLAGCSSVQVVDKMTYGQVKTTIRQGEQKNWQAIENAMALPEPPKHPGLHVYILNDLATVNDEKARGIIRKYLKNPASEKRSAALLALDQHRKGREAKIDKELVDAISDNSGRYKKLLDAEIQILGRVNDNRADSLLKSYLGKNEAQDALIIQAIGGKLQRQMNSPAPPPPAPGDKSKMFDRSDAANQRRETLGNEQVLLDYLKTEASFDLKKLTLTSLYRAYQPRGRQRLLMIVENKSMPTSTRILTARYLTQLGLKSQGKLIAKNFRRIYFQSRGEIELKENLVLQIAKLEDKSPIDVLNEIRQVFWKKQWKREAIATKKANYMRYVRNVRAMPPKDALKTIFKSGGLSANTVTKMHKHVIKTIREGNLNRKPESRFLYAALRKLYPRKNYYQLNELGQRSLRIRYLFSTVMGMVLKEYRGDAIQVTVLSKVWGVKRREARAIKRLYLRRNRLIKQVNL